MQHLGGLPDGLNGLQKEGLFRASSCDMTVYRSYLRSRGFGVMRGAPLWSRDAPQDAHVWGNYAGARLRGTHVVEAMIT
eukprot:366545-Chlamydomonas_euryale.AAC.10